MAHPVQGSNTLTLTLTWQCKQAKAKYRQTFEELREVRSK